MILGWSVTLHHEVNSVKTTPFGLKDWFILDRFTDIQSTFETVYKLIYKSLV